LRRKKPAHVARAALARKLLVTVWAMLRGGMVFDESIFAAVQGESVSFVVILVLRERRSDGAAESGHTLCASSTNRSLSASPQKFPWTGVPFS
jgi:hypothetical protein